MAHATEEWNGTVQVDICDADGNRVGYGSQAPFAFPTNNSQDDIAALKAIAEANPLNSDLQNFISSKDYLKDRGPDAERWLQRGRDVERRVPEPGEKLLYKGL